VRALLLNRKKICPANDDDDDDAAASEMGELFSTTKAKVSLSLFLSSTKHPTARANDEKNKSKLSLTSLFVFFERARREHKFYY
jgi:hypothetical protein